MAKGRTGVIVTTIELRVIPRAKRDAVEGFTNDVLRVRVTAAPQDGSANQAVVKLLASRLGVSRSAIAIIGGSKSRDKVVEIVGLSLRAVQQRLLDSE